MRIDQQESVYIGHVAAIPVYLHWSALFLLVMAWRWTPSTGAVRIDHILLFALVLCSGILLHELGHGLMAKALGAMRIKITLWAMGGLCSSTRDSLPRREIMILAAGPAVSFALAAASYGLLRWVAHESPQWLVDSSGHWTLIGNALVFGYQINLVLGIFNIFPIYPLDGGQIVFNVLRLFMDLGRTIALSLSISVVVAAAFVIWSFNQSGQLDVYLIVLMGYLLFNAFQTLR
jgi:stage IV sporulation protein FB